MRDVLSVRQGAPGRRTVVHWITVFLLSVSGLLTIVTGVYFLVLPSGGYQGGRNPDYGKTFLFDRDVWVDIHTWTGILMVAVAIFHIALHWRWVAEMTKRSAAIVAGRRRPFNRKIWLRVGVVAAVGLAFVGVAASGIYFFILPNGREGKFIVFLFGKNTWDLIHAWTGIVMIIVAVLHLAQRWKWVIRVTNGVVHSVAAKLVPPRATTAAAMAPQEGLPEGGAP